MPNPYIEWTDSVGLARMTCLVPVLNGWTPDVDKIGPRAVSLGTGVTSQFLFRTDYVVSFSFPYVAAIESPQALRLKAHLLAGGTLTVFTGDLAGRTYSCILRPGTEPSISQDPENLEFALDLELKNLGGTPFVASWQGAGLLLTPDTDYLALGGTFTRATTATYYAGP